MVNPQALIPNRPTVGDALMSLVKSRDVVFEPTRLVTADGVAFESDFSTLPTSIKFLQNCGTNAVKYKIGDDITGADDFHGILAGGSAQDDGLGSVVNLSNVQQPIYIAAVTGTPRVATIKGQYNA